MDAHLLPWEQHGDYSWVTCSLVWSTDGWNIYTSVAQPLKKWPRAPKVRGSVLFSLQTFTKFNINNRLICRYYYLTDVFQPREFWSYSHNIVWSSFKPIIRFRRNWNCILQSGSIEATISKSYLHYTASEAHISTACCAVAITRPIKTGKLLNYLHSSFPLHEPEIIPFHVLTLPRKILFQPFLARTLFGSPACKHTNSVLRC